MTRPATKDEICDAIEATLGASSVIKDSQTYDELTEGVNTFPTLQVYPLDSSGGSGGGQTSRITMGASNAVRVENVTIVADVYCSQRKDLKNDMRKVIEVWDALDAILYAQDARPFFGLAAIREFSWTATYGERPYGDAQIVYGIVQYQLRLVVY